MNKYNKPVTTCWPLRKVELQMSMHYNAFISYRNVKEDSRVAAMVQHSLEHYRIPVQIREKTGIRKIDRIFRDKEELAITSSLGDSISEALDHSDFLIVICSVRTEESSWVQREIEYFLKNHSKNKVLTVLVDGEPQDVIPEILKVDRHTHISPDGTVHEEESRMEPLSCDLRSGNRRSRRNEILRLVAALLGCTYDELVMRDKQYRRKRLSVAVGALFVIMLCTISYLNWSRVQIRDNYLKSLKNQSIYLSTRAGQLMEHGDRITAIQLAEEALPHDDERPLVPEAEAVLSNALHVYVPPNSSSGVYDTVLELQTYSDLMDSDISPDEQYICALDTSSQIYVWDAMTGKEVLRLCDEEDEVAENYGTAGDGERVLFGTDNALFVLKDTHVQSYNVADGTLRWDYEFGKNVSSVYSMCLDPSKEHLFFGYRKYSSAENGSNELICVCLDTVSGMETERSVANLPEGQSILFSDCALSGDCRYFAIGYNYLWGDQGAAVLVFDMINDMVSEMNLPETSWKIDSLTFGGTTDQLAVLSFPDYGDLGVGSIDLAGRHRVIDNARIQVSLFNVVDGNCKWSNGFVNSRSNLVPIGKGLSTYNYPPDAATDGNASRYILCKYANQAVLFRMEDGSIYDSIEFEGQILSTFLAGADIKFILNNGNIGTYMFNIEWKGVEIEYFPGEYYSGSFYNDNDKGTARFLLQNKGNSMLVFGVVWDEDFTRYDAMPLPSEFIIEYSAIVSDHLILADYDGNFYSYDLSGENDVAAGHLDSHLRCAKADNQNGVVWFLDADNKLVRFSTTDGSIKRYELSCQPFNSEFWLLHDGRICFLSHGNNKNDYDILILSESDGELVPMRYATVSTGFGFEGIMESPSGIHILLVDTDLDKHYTVRFEVLESDVQVGPKKSGSGSQVEEDKDILISEMAIGGPVTAAAWDEQEKYCAFTDSQTIYVADIKGNLLFRTEMTGLKARSLCIHDKTLFVLYSAGYLVRYDLISGEKLGTTRISFYYTYSGESPRTSPLKDAEWFFRDDYLVLFSKDGGKLLNIIETRTWKEIGYSQYAIGYDRLRDRLLSLERDSVSKENFLGWYSRYSLNDLFRKAEEAVGTMWMSEDERASYGLE